MSTFESRARPVRKLISKVLCAFDKHLPAVERFIDSSFDGLFKFFDTTLSRMLSAVGKGIALGFTLGLVSIVFAFGAWGLYVSAAGCARPLDYITELLPKFPDMPRPVGMPHSTLP